MRAGQDVVLDKPVSRRPLSSTRSAQVHAETGRRWLVVFGERLGNPAMVEAGKLVARARIGDVVNTVGLGPHTLEPRSTGRSGSSIRRAYGGILVDIGSHEVDQFLNVHRRRRRDVLASTVGPPGTSRVCRCSARCCCAATTGAPVTPASTTSRPRASASWGDVRFTVVGRPASSRSDTAEALLVLVDGD